MILHDAEVIDADILDRLPKAVEPLLRVSRSAGAAMTSGSNSSWVQFTAPPEPPDEVSMCSNAGQNRSKRLTAPSAAVTGSVRATFLISKTDSLSRFWRGSIPSSRRSWPENEF